MDALAQILAQAVSHDDPQDWLKVVRFYLQAERYRDARLELEKIIARFPEMKGLEAEARQLKQMGARRILKEIELRRDAGQHELVSRLLENFPPEEVAGETLQQVREMMANYKERAARLEAVKQQLQDLADKVSDADHRRLIQPLVDEILADLSHNNLQRLVPLQPIGRRSIAVGRRESGTCHKWLGAGSRRRHTKDFCCDLTATGTRHGAKILARNASSPAKYDFGIDPQFRRSGCSPAWRG